MFQYLVKSSDFSIKIIKHHCIFLKIVSSKLQISYKDLPRHVLSERLKKESAEIDAKIDKLFACPTDSDENDKDASFDIVESENEVK